MKANFTLDSSEFETKISLTEQNVIRHAKEAMKTMADEIFAESQAHVPVQTGMLKASGKVLDKSKDGEIKYIISYGNDMVNPTRGVTVNSYALARHEQIDLPFNKWLEMAMLSNINMTQDVISATIAKALS